MVTKERDRLAAVIAGVIVSPTSAYALDDREAMDLAMEIADLLIADGWSRQVDSDAKIESVPA